MKNFIKISFYRINLNYIYGYAFFHSEDSDYITLRLNLNHEFKIEIINFTTDSTSVNYLELEEMNNALDLLDNLLLNERKTQRGSGLVI